MKVYFFLALLLIGSSARTQCPGEVVSLLDPGYHCPGDTLSLVASGPISKIVWYKDGEIVRTDTASTIISPVAIIAGGNGQGAAANQFAGPWQIAVDANGYLYVSDGGNTRIQRFPPGSTSRTPGTTVAVSPQRNENSYSGLVLDGNGNSYVSDADLDAVQKFAPGNTIGVTVAGGNGSGWAANQFGTPETLCLDAAGNLYVVDLNTFGFDGRVQKWAPGAAAGVTVAGASSNSLIQPVGVAVDEAGNVYVSELWDSRITKWAPGANNGVIVAGGNDSGNAANQFNYPRGICRANDGTLYVADSRNHRIQKWAPGATEGVTVAGGNGPGNGFNQLYLPDDVCLDSEGKLYISDLVNQRILKLQQTIYTYIDSLFVPRSPGVYTAVVTIAGSCSLTTNAVVIRTAVDPGLRVLASANPVCSGTPVVANAITDSAGLRYAFQWLVNGAPVADSSTAYTEPHPTNGEVIACSVNDAPACVTPVVDSVVMTVNPLPAVASDQVFSVAHGQSIILTPALSGDVATYSWSPAAGLSATGIADPVADPENTIDYQLTVTTAEGCKDSGSIEVYVFIPLNIPSAFTPNGDGRNDVFYVLGGPAGLIIKELAVFDRWGVRVFQAHDAPAGDRSYGWNGQEGGSPAPAGTYVYILSVRLPDGRQQQSKGTVLLIR